MTTNLVVEQAGPFVSIQDQGRPGYMRFGVPGSGPMDRFAFSVLKTALNGGEDFSAIEVSVAGVRIRCSGNPVTGAVVGGKFYVDVDGKQIAPWSVFTLESGQTVTVRGADEGSWAYLGFAGDIQSPQWLGSRSTHLYSGLCGQPLQGGDQVTLNHSRVINRDRELSRPRFSRYCGSVRVVLGPQESLFTPKAIQNLLEGEFQITPNYNRMGMALRGPKLEIQQALTMPSEGLVRGAIQVTGDGAPTILMADHQTTGGYPKIATVISMDVNQLAQARPGDTLRFIPVSADEAVLIARKANVLLRDYFDGL